MRIWPRLALVALLGPGAVGLASAAEDEDVSDIKCVAVAFHMMQQEKEDLRTAGMFSVIYFLGRLDGRSPKADVEAMLADAALTMSAEDLQREALRCGDLLQERSERLKEISESLIKRGQDMLQNPQVPGHACE